MGARVARIVSLAVALLAAGATGCRTGPEPAAFRVGIESTPTTLDPRYAAGAHAVRILPLLFHGLLKADPSGRLVPDLAVTWQQPDERTHVLRLRQGVRFHDGSELTARDVVATYRYVADPAHGCPASGALEPLRSVEAPDPYTVVFRLKRVYVSFPSLLTLGILPQGLANRKDLGDRVVGTGPYRLAAFRPGEEIVLEAFPEHFEGPPSLERIRFRIIPNATTRLLEIRSGGLDLLQNAVPPYSVRFLRRDPNLQVIVSPGTSYQYIGFNCEDPILKDVRVRRAIAYAVDRQALIRFALDGLARPATTLFPPEHWAHNPDVPTYPYDPDRARRLLDEAGYPDPDGPGPAVRFRLSYKTSTDKTANEVARVIAEQLGRVGIGVEVRSFEWGTFFSDVKRGDFQLMSLRWIGLRDPDVFHYLFHSASVPPRGANRGRYRNPQVDAWIDESRRTPDPERRRELYFRIQQAVARDCVYVSLWWLDNVVVLRRGYTGFEPLPGGEYTSLARVRPEGAP
ncbi:MAG: ABC transporter substrate-binding protein [Deltaproteobacteria bacterium]|nr:ABC transporter substrate-binding protein [Deltaproteobacteria bacterium]